MGRSLAFGFGSVPIRSVSADKGTYSQSPHEAACLLYSLTQFGVPVRASKFCPFSIDSKNASLRTRPRQNFCIPAIPLYRSAPCKVYASKQVITLNYTTNLMITSISCQDTSGLLLQTDIDKFSRHLVHIVNAVGNICRWEEETEAKCHVRVSIHSSTSKSQRRSPSPSGIQNRVTGLISLT